MVDRLDPAKGLVERLEANERLLIDNSTLRENVTMLMQVIPSREEIAEYQQLKQSIELLIERINNAFSSEK
jgi:trehalose 6-phosphate synthase/phosphatase